MATPLPTIAEPDATGEIAALYADLRAVLGVPVVNLIWRHVATLPGALAWSWSVLRPLYASGAADAAAERLLAGLHLPELPRLAPHALAAAGVPAAEQETLRRVVTVYHRANPLNLVALAALLRYLRQGPLPSAPDAPAPDAPHPPAQPPPLPPMLDVAELAPPVAEQVRALAAVGLDAAPAPGETPSAWRHLAHWPGYLGLAVELLRPPVAAGWLAREMDGLRVRRDREAEVLLATALVRPAAPLAASARAPLEAVLARFTDGLIVRMIPLLALLHATLPPAHTDAAR